MIEKKGSDRNQEGFPFLVFISLSLQVYNSNKNIWIDFFQVCEINWTKWGNGKIIEGSWIRLNTHSRAQII